MFTRALVSRVDDKPLPGLPAGVQLPSLATIAGIIEIFIRMRGNTLTINHDVRNITPNQLGLSALMAQIQDHGNDGTVVTTQRMFLNPALMAEVRVTPALATGIAENWSRIIEQAGGQGSFAEALRRQLQDALSNNLQRVTYEVAIEDDVGGLPIRILLAMVDIVWTNVDPTLRGGHPKHDPSGL
jgi:hypothetical protein